MKLLSIILLVVHIWLKLVAVGKTHPCRTPCGGLGNCVVLDRCYYLRDILRRSGGTQTLAEYVNNSRCGPAEIRRICCPIPSTPESCGVVSTRKIKFDILVGHVYPWSGMLAYEKKDFSTDVIFPKCAATLIHSRYLLTAAHCTFDTEDSLTSRWTLRSVRFQWHERAHPGCVKFADYCLVEYAIADISRNPEFRKQPALYDVALLKLKKEVEFNQYVQPICLPFDEVIWKRPLVSGELTLVRWIQSETVGSIRRTAPFYDCHGGSSTSLADHTICLDGSAESCSDDLGGALMQQMTEASKWYQVGLVGFDRQSCGSSGSLEKHTNIARYLDWIQDKVYGGGCYPSS